jgi:hypothetical protein
VILPDQPLLEFFARAGGGGSSGGGSSGGSGGGGLVSLLIFIGYVPSQWVGSLFRKGNQVLLGSLLLWPMAFVSLIAFSWLMGIYGFLIACGVIAGTGSGLYGWLGKAIKRSKKIGLKLQTAEKSDPAWDEATLLEATSKTFYKFQTDWMNSDSDSIKTYTTPAYFYHTSLMLHALKLAGRKNMMEAVRIDSQNITSLNDAEGVRGDSVTVGFKASAVDSLIETATGATLYTDTSSFIEYWTFLRDEDGWKLDHIDQATASYSAVSSELRDFALTNNYCFSLDWGWLLLPKRGQLFAKGKFGTSDINNHIIGNYKESLVQLYTYQPNPNADVSGMKYYLIAQANVQKTYGNIVVRRKKFLQGGIRDLQKVETEWTSFNKNYEVFASSSEGATSFELLEPTFMEKLNALSFEVNIEVVDNVVYLYSQEKKINPAHYPEMLAILHEAYTYMKR